MKIFICFCYATLLEKFSRVLRTFFIWTAETGDWSKLEFASWWGLRA